MRQGHQKAFAHLKTHCGHGSRGATKTHTPTLSCLSKAANDQMSDIGPCISDIGPCHETQEKRQTKKKVTEGFPPLCIHENV
jgi:hypothetical protein